MTETPVVVIGAGPTGMAAAALVATHGVASTVYEREADIVAIPRAVHLDEEVLRILHGTRLGPDVALATRPIRGMILVDGARRPLISFAREGRGAHGFARSNAFDQPEFERAMRDALAREPLVTLRTATSVEAVEHLPGGRLRVMVLDRDRDVLEEVETRAVLACDGARSRSRSFVGTDFEDLGFEARWLVVDVLTDAPLGLYEGCLQVADPERPTTYFCTGGGRHRWEIMLRTGETAEEMTRDGRVRELLAPWLGDATSTATLRRRAVYTFHSLVARRFRRGNLFLLGDAAHQTPPFIGQGMAAGVRDAANLAWKLAAVLQGVARPELLDTYERERRPHVRQVIQQAVMLGRTMKTMFGGRYRDDILERLGAIDAVRDLIVARAFPPYATGPLVRPRGSGPAGGHVPRAVVEVDGRATHLDDVLGTGFALLWRDSVLDGAWRVRRLGDARSYLTVIDLEGALSAWSDELGASAALVRPDRVVMASGELSAARGWIEALSRACGWRHASPRTIGMESVA